MALRLIKYHACQVKSEFLEIDRFEAISIVTYDGFSIRRDLDVRKIASN